MPAIGIRHNLRSLSESKASVEVGNFGLHNILLRLEIDIVSTGDTKRVASRSRAKLNCRLSHLSLLASVPKFIFSEFAIEHKYNLMFVLKLCCPKERSLDSSERP